MSFLKNLFGRRVNGEKSNGAAVMEAPSPAAVVPRNGLALESIPEPAVAPPKSAPDGETVPILLKAITDLFPPELKPALHKQPSEHFTVGIPKALIQPQLGSGVVRITFAQLLAVTPEIFFQMKGIAPDTKIQLPLDVILKQMMPARRGDQQQATTPVNVPSIFGKSPEAKGSGNSAAEPWFSQRRPSYDGPGIEPEPGTTTDLPEIANAAAVPVPEAELKMPDAAKAPEAPVAAPEAKALKMPAAEPVAAVKAAPAGTVKSFAFFSDNKSAAAPEIEPKAAPTPKPAPAASETPTENSEASRKPFWPAGWGEKSAEKKEEPTTASAAPATSTTAETLAPTDAPIAAPTAQLSGDIIQIPLSLILPGLLPETQEALGGTNPAEVSLLIPKNDFEAQMRRGKLQFKLSQLQAWRHPGPAGPSTPDVDVDLPLAKLVPIFLASLKAQEERKKIQIDSRIPEVFAKGGAESTIPSEPEKSTSPAAEISVPSPVEPASVPALQIEKPTKSAEASSASPFSIVSDSAAPISTIAETAAQSPAVEASAEAPLPFRLENSAPEITSTATPAGEAAPAVEVAAQVSSSPAAESIPAEPVKAEAVPASDATHEASPEPAPQAAAISAFPEPVSPAVSPEPIAPAIVAAPDSSHGLHEPTAPSESANGPALILQRIRTLENVTGAFLATSDGILIAADLPEGNENILAAFAPTVFAQLKKYSEMARLGSPVSIDLHFGSASIHVRKTGKVFLGIVSPAGRQLPLAEVNLVAASI